MDFKTESQLRSEIAEAWRLVDQYKAASNEIKRLREDLALAQGQRNASNREIERLRDLLELDESGVDGIQCRDETIKVQDDEIRKLRAKLEAVQRTVESYYEELAASQAREAKLRTVLKHFHKYGPIGSLEEMAARALAMPTDDSTLRERLRMEQERVFDAVEKEWYAQGLDVRGASVSDFLAAIRAMSDE